MKPEKFNKINVVRVKGLEPPRQRRQNLNSAKIEQNQAIALIFSQDISETNHETAKPAKDTGTKENPGPLAGATGVYNQGGHDSSPAIKSHILQSPASPQVRNAA